jgi:hypothetical protein
MCCLKNTNTLLYTIVLSMDMDLYRCTVNKTLEMDLFLCCKKLRSLLQEMCIQKACYFPTASEYKFYSGRN